MVEQGLSKEEHGRRLKTAMAAKGLERQVIADATEQQVRTVTNWTSGATMPSEAARIVLRRMLGEYDTPGDPVESALRQSELIEWRRGAVLAEYQRHLYEQRTQGQRAD